LSWASSAAHARTGIGRTGTLRGVNAFAWKSQEHAERNFVTAGLLCKIVECNLADGSERITAGSSPLRTQGPIRRSPNCWKRKINALK
jgi:hypothetical protein